ncbi:uncharacterized protein LOC5505043 isoform X1 [Nematostella vectensis]|uniref:uncharacterized protein LOC5505043 isoform X1 n=1 Tax=Nematostella vectensis TaxID=45351 RepID=UPI00207744E8|nr:uncharacterized protein LOC5505043 isoform X1 [Nematostella vectensis]
MEVGEIPSMDVENRIVTGGKKKSSRRSSILKTSQSPIKGVLEDIDLNAVSEKGDRKSKRSSGRRVSFAPKNEVKEFCKDYDDHHFMPMLHSEYRPPTTDIKGLESLLSGNIQSREQQFANQNTTLNEPDGCMEFTLCQPFSDGGQLSATKHQFDGPPNPLSQTVIDADTIDLTCHGKGFVSVNPASFLKSLSSNQENVAQKSFTGSQWNETDNEEGCVEMTECHGNLLTIAVQKKRRSIVQPSDLDVTQCFSAPIITRESHHPHSIEREDEGGSIEMTECHGKLMTTAVQKKRRSIVQPSDLDVTQCFSAPIITEQNYHSHSSQSTEDPVVGKAQAWGNQSCYNGVSPSPCKDDNRGIEMTECHGGINLTVPEKKKARKSILVPADVDVTQCYNGPIATETINPTSFQNSIYNTQPTSNQHQARKDVSYNTQKNIFKGDKLSWEEQEQSVLDVDLTVCAGKGLLVGDGEEGEMVQSEDVDLTICTGKGLLPLDAEDESSPSLNNPSHFDLTVCEGAFLKGSDDERGEDGKAESPMTVGELESGPRFNYSNATDLGINRSRTMMASNYDGDTSFTDLEPKSREWLSQTAPLPGQTTSLPPERFSKTQFMKNDLDASFNPSSQRALLPNSSLSKSHYMERELNSTFDASSQMTTKAAQNLSKAHYMERELDSTFDDSSQMTSKAASSLSKSHYMERELNSTFDALNQMTSKATPRLSMSHYQSQTASQPSVSLPTTQNMQNDSDSAPGSPVPLPSRKRTLEDTEIPSQERNIDDKPPEAIKNRDTKSSQIQQWLCQTALAPAPSSMTGKFLQKAPITCTSFATSSAFNLLGTFSSKKQKLAEVNDDITKAEETQVDLEPAQSTVEPQSLEFTDNTNHIRNDTYDLNKEEFPQECLLSEGDDDLTPAKPVAETTAVSPGSVIEPGVNVAPSSSPVNESDPLPITAPPDAAAATGSGISPAVSIIQDSPVGPSRSSCLKRNLSTICEESPGRTPSSKKKQIKVAELLSMSGIFFDTRVTSRRSTVAFLEKMEKPKTISEAICMSYIIKPKAEQYLTVCDEVEKELTELRAASEFVVQQLDASDSGILQIAGAAGDFEQSDLADQLNDLHIACKKLAKKKWSEKKKTLKRRVAHSLKEYHNMLSSDLGTLSETLSVANDCAKLLCDVEAELDAGLARIHAENTSEENVDPSSADSNDLGKESPELLALEEELSKREAYRQELTSEKEALTREKNGLEREEIECEELVLRLGGNAPFGDNTDELEHKYKLLNELSEWTLEEWEPARLARFTFLNSTLDLNVTFGDTLPDGSRHVQSISLISALSESSKSGPRLAHALIQDSIADTTLQKMCPTSSSLEKVLHHVSGPVITARKLADEVFLLPFTHIVHVQGTSLFVEFFSLQKLMRFIVQFTFDINSYPDLVVFNVTKKIGKFDPQEVHNSLEAVSSGGHYLTRLVDAADAFLSGKAAS